MPQIAPVTLGTVTYGAPRVVKNGTATLFIKLDPISGALGDEKLYVGEDSFSSTRPRRKAYLRMETPILSTDPVTGTVKQVDSVAVEITLEHGKSVSETALVDLRDRAAAALTNQSYTDLVLFKRDGQW